MRLDHLLSKEHERKFKSFGQQGRASRKKALFNFEDTQGERVSAKRSLKNRGKPEHGGVAQLGEHLLCKQGVNGSNPLFSTPKEKAGMKYFIFPLLPLKDL